MSVELAARRVANDFLRPRAEAVDRLDLPLRPNFEALASAGLAGLTIPAEYEGAGVPNDVQRRVGRELAAACGVTNFTVAQHYSACKHIAQGQAEPLKRRLLPELARGHQWVAIAFAHLRRPGKPLLRATPVEGGYRLDGEAPWLTGWGLMDSAVIGCTLPDGRFVYLWSEFLGSRGSPAGAAGGERGSLQASEPMRLCAMQASATVKLAFSEWFVPQEHVLSFTDLPSMVQADRDNVLNATHMTLGCLRASVELVERLAGQKKLPAIGVAAAALRQRWERLERAIDTAGTEFDANLGLRLDSIQQAVQASHAAVAAASGAANMGDHPAQRLYREAMFYTVQAQTQEVLTGLLERIANKVYTK